MARLEDLTPGARVRGVLPDRPVTVVQAEWHGTTEPENGYRKYYVHLSEPDEIRLPQLASLWVLFFYFGSIVRYRPHLFDAVTAGRYGAFVTEFINAQAPQLLYLLASEMCSREIARPAII